jgi:uncharacterized membrane protein YhhN
MGFSFLGIALGIAVLDWIAVANRWKHIEYFAKPAVMLVLLIWLGLNSGFSGSLIWFSFGLLLSMAGDIFLMLPKEQFIPGLVSFLFAHIFYLVGFTHTLPPINLPAFILALVIGITAVQFYRQIAAALEASQKPALKLPVKFYITVISLMLFSALLTLLRPEWNFLPAMLASLGAMLFFLSDGFLAWDKFVSPFRHGDLMVIVNYHLGQILIILGAAIHFGAN